MEEVWEMPRRADGMRLLDKGRGSAAELSCCNQQPRAEVSLEKSALPCPALQQDPQNCTKTGISKKVMFLRA